MMKTSLALAFAATAVLLTETMSTFAHEITDSPHREIVDANTYPWSSIGKLGAKVDRLGSCTGVVVGSNQFLTAAHCLYNKAAGRFVSAESVHFSLAIGVNTACAGLRRGTRSRQRSSQRSNQPKSRRSTTIGLSCTLVSHSPQK